MKQFEKTIEQLETFYLEEIRRKDEQLAVIIFFYHYIFVNLIIKFIDY